MIELKAYEESTPPENSCVVKLKTSTWNDSRGLHIKKSITYLRRKCVGFNFLEEEVSAIGPEEAARSIINLDECKDGIYEVVICNETHDWESGIVDGWSLKLVPFKC